MFCQNTQPSVCASGLCPYPHKETIKRNCQQDPKYAFKQYVTVYHACFKPATSPQPYGSTSSSYFRKEGVKECYERLKKWDTQSLHTGAMKGNGDEMIEYCLRLLTGVKAPFDEDAAFPLLRKIIQCVDYTLNQRAIAASLACTYYKRRLLEAGRVDSANAFVLADMSCKFGLFTWTALDLIRLYETEKEDPEIKLADAIDLWREYAKYREETGIQRKTKVLCARCGKPPGNGQKMKQCSGNCVNEKKPVYCSRECQKVDWSKHKKWCKLQSDVDWKACRRDDWEYSDDSDFGKLLDE